MWSDETYIKVPLVEWYSPEINSHEKKTANEQQRGNHSLDDIKIYIQRKKKKDDQRRRVPSF